MTDALLLARLPGGRRDRLLPTRDATAGQLGAALLHDSDGVQSLRAQASVRCTTRREPQGLVWVLLAAADLRPPAVAAAFGSGPHRCPGGRHTRELASDVLAGLAGLAAVTEEPREPEARTELRTPERVLEERA